MDTEDFSNYLDEDTFFEDDIDNQIDGDVEEDEIIMNEEKDVFVNKERGEKLTAPVMTIYEKVNIISQRIKQLDNNYKTTLNLIIKNYQNYMSLDLFRMVLMKGGL